MRKLNNSRIAILDTRKTLPAFRSLQKYAVICGGGKNHRFDLSSQILIKDNHLASCKKNIASLLDISKKKYKNLQAEIECDEYWQVLEALESQPDIIMLDNMNMQNLNQLAQFVKKILKLSLKFLVELILIISVIIANLILIAFRLVVLHTQLRLSILA